MRHPVVVVAVILASVVAVVYADQMSEDFDAMLADKDGDGFPDGMDVEANPNSRCYSIGHTLSEFLAYPLHIVGVVLYTILYPIIVVAEFLRQIMGWLLAILMYIPKLLLWMLGWVLWVVLQIILFIPWLIMKMFVLLGSTVAQLVLLLVLLGVVVFAFTNVGATLGIVVILTMVVLAALIIQYGLGILLAILMCPMQFTYGTLMGFASDLTYLNAALTLSYVA